MSSPSTQRRDYVGIALVITALGTILVPGFSCLESRRAAEAARVAVSEVKTTLATATESTDKKLDEIHTLTNAALTAANERGDAALAELAAVKALLTAERAKP